MASEREPWFGRKRFGIGVGPRTWQGALVVLAIVAVLAVIRYLTVR